MKLAPILGFAAALGLGTVGLTLTGCEDDNTMEEAGEQIDEAVDEAGDAAEEAVEDVGDAAEDAAR